MREFVAIDVGERLTGGAGGVTPHLTLRFLGEVSAEQNPSIVARLTEVAAQCAPFTLRLEGVGAFPTADRPRVVWVGVTTGREALTDLAGRVRTALEVDFGVERESFVPHLTLFRVRGPQDRRAAADLLAGVRPAPSPRDVQVRDLLLKESLLRPGGAVHRTLAAVPLSQGRPALA